MQETKNYQPSNAKEKELLRIWKDVLGRDDIAINDDFFKIGGNSLYAIKIFGRLSSVFDISMNDLFASTTIEKLAQHISFRKGGRTEELNALKSAAKMMDSFKMPERDQKLLDAYAARSSSPALKKQPEPKCVFITGACGYFGANYLGNMLLESGSDAVCVIRSADDSAAFDRLKNVLEHYFPGENLLERFSGRVTVYSGDLSKEHLDLSDEKYLYLTENTDCILHCAGLVKHFGAWSEFEKANVTVTEKMISLAKQGREKRLLFISTMGTAYTSDRFESKLPFTEYDLPSGEIDDNFYLRSKTIAEQLVNAAAKDGLDAKIFRLGYLTQSEKTGIFQINAKENAFFRLLGAIEKIGVIADSKAEIFDFTFIDSATRAVRLLGDTTDDWNVYHIFNPNQLSVLRIAQLMNACGEDIKITTADDFTEYMNENADKYPEELTDILLATYVLEPEIDQTLVLKVRCTRTASALAQLDFKWTPVNEKHMSDVLKILKS
ncbi:MAG: SDR family oxidoreductase [Christensenellaceae bacterium]